jgi:hypothetical protein
VGLFSVSTLPAKATYWDGCHDQQIAWPSQSYYNTFATLVDNGEDRILVKQTSDPDLRFQSKIRINLETASTITWWKGLTATYSQFVQYGSNDIVVASTSTQDATHNASTTFDLVKRDFSANGTSDYYYGLQLSKAKFLGIHTGMYCLNLVGKVTSTLTFRWEKD